MWANDLHGVETDAVVVLVSNPEDTIRDPWLTFTALADVQVIDDPLLPAGELEADLLTNHLRPLPEDVAAWLLGLPAFHAEELADSVEIDGKKATAFSFDARDVAKGWGPCTEYACIAFDYTGGDQPGIGVMAEGVRGRAYLVPEDAPTMLVLAGARREQWSEFEPVVERTLERLELR